MRKYIATMLISITLIFGASGCEGIPKSGAMQLRENFLLVKKDYKKYLDKDPRYTENPDGKEDRLKLIDDSVKLIDEAIK